MTNTKRDRISTNRLFWIILGVILAGFLTPLRATQLVPMDDAELTNGADLVVLATVRVLSTSLDGQEAPGFSFVILDVVETWKGRKAAAVTLKVLGGQTSLEDPKSVRVAGAPVFVPGESAVFFLNARPEEGFRFYNVRGWGQGRLRLQDPHTLSDGRKLGTLRNAVERHVKNPRPARFPSPRQLRERRPAVVDGQVETRPLSPSRREGKGKRPGLSTREAPSPSRSPLTQEESRKRDEMKREIGRLDGRGKDR